MSGKKLRGRCLDRHKLRIYKQRIVYFSCIYSEPMSSTIKLYFRIRQQYPPVFSTTTLTALLLGDHGNTPHVPSLRLHASHLGDIYAQHIRGQGAIILVSAGGERGRQLPVSGGQWKPGPCCQVPGPSAWCQQCWEVPCSVAHGVTSLWGAAPVRTNCTTSRMVQAEAISALGATNRLRSRGGVSTLDISRPHAYHIAAGICAWDELGATRLLVRHCPWTGSVIHGSRVGGRAGLVRLRRCAAYTFAPTGVGDTRDLAPSTAWRKKEPLLYETFLVYHDSIRSDHTA
jgi:hypothetical protein